MTDYDLIRRCDVLEILEYEGFLGRTRKLVEQLVAVTTEAQAAEIERLRAKLTDAADVIEWALICWDDHNKHGYTMQGDWVPDARAIVAELKGQEDD